MKGLNEVVFKYITHLVMSMNITVCAVYMTGRVVNRGHVTAWSVVKLAS